MKKLCVIAITLVAAFLVFFSSPKESSITIANEPTVSAAETNEVLPKPETPPKVEIVSVQEPIKETVKKVSPQQVSVVKSRLVIPSAGVNAPVKGMGLELDGKMAVPDNYKEIGWYKLGTKPGQMGSAVMGAHVDNGGFTPTIPGVFKNIHKMKIGDEIYYFDEAGKQLTFKVTEVKIYDKNIPDTTEIFGRNDKARLNLITCFGTWLPKEKTYDKRIIIFAELVSPQ